MLYLGFGLLVSVLWSVALKRPALALAFIYATAPFVSDLSGGGSVKFSIAELSLLVITPIFVRQCAIKDKWPSLGPLAIPLILWFAISLFSSLLNWRGHDALLSIIQMALYLILAVGVFSSFLEQEEDLELPLLCLVGVCVFLATLVVITRSGFVLGLQKNLVGGVLSCGVIIAVELWFAANDRKRQWLLAGALAIITVGLILSLSRGAWLSTLCGITLIAFMRRQFALLLRGAILLVPLVAIAWNFLPKQSQEYATGFGGERYNIKLRYESIDIAKNYYTESPIYGNGVGLRKEYDATNLALLTLAETGILGLLALLFLHFSFFHMIWTAQQRLQRSDKLYSLLAIGGALVLGKFAHGMVDHYWSRGIMLIVWAGAGMAIAVYKSAPRSLIAHNSLRYRHAVTAMALLHIKELRMRELKGR